MEPHLQSLPSTLLTQCELQPLHLFYEIEYTASYLIHLYNILQVQTLTIVYLTYVSNSNNWRTSAIYRFLSLEMVLV